MRRCGGPTKGEEWKDPRTVQRHREQDGPAAAELLVAVAPLQLVAQELQHPAIDEHRSDSPPSGLAIGTDDDINSSDHEGTPAAGREADVGPDQWGGREVDPGWEENPDAEVLLQDPPLTAPVLEMRPQLAGALLGRNVTQLKLYDVPETFSVADREAVAPSSGWGCLEHMAALAMTWVGNRSVR